MTTRIELISRSFFDELLPNYTPIFNYRPDWLKNKETGKNLEIDIFYPELKLAIEVNGIFHALNSSKKRDRYKFLQCKKFGIWYEEVKFIDDLLKIAKRINKETGEQVNLSHELMQEIADYKPNKLCFSRNFMKAKKREKYFEHFNPIFEKYKKEREMNLARMKLKGWVK